MPGVFITFEGGEGCGKSTQVALLSARLQECGLRVLTLREPGGTSIGEEIRHTLKHSLHNDAMTSEAELLLMNASRAQLVREVIRPALERGDIVICDRFFDSTTAYQGYGRGLPEGQVRAIIDFAVGSTRPDLTLLLQVPPDVAARRVRDRQANLPFVRDRFEEADREFFARVEAGYEQIARTEPDRVKRVDASGEAGEVHGVVWRLVEPVVRQRQGEG